MCWLVPPDVRTWLPFEEGIRHSWTGGLVIHPVGWGWGWSPLGCP